MLESIIVTTLRQRQLTMHDYEIASVVKEIEEHKRWFGRRLTPTEKADAIAAAIKKLARPA